MNPHSVIEYMYLKAQLAAQDRDNVRNQWFRERVYNKDYSTFAMLKRLFLYRMKIEGKLICVYCQKPLEVYAETFKGNLPSDYATIEHIVPISEGGLKYDESNFACACSSCNNRRGTLPAFKISETQYIF